VFITRSRKVYEAIERDHPGGALWAFSLRAFWVALRSEWRVVSHWWKDVAPVGYSMRRRIVALNHGVPLKRMGYAKLRPNLKATARYSRRLIFVTAASPLEETLWQQTFGLGPDRTRLTGHPRNDAIITAIEAKRRDERTPPRVVLYAPTFLDWAPRSDFLPVAGMDVAVLSKVLERHDAQLLIRPHYFETNSAGAFVRKLNNPRIRLADFATVPDAAMLLPDVDVLVTDYSSIYIDFLLTGRSMIFTPVDQERYEKQRGLFLDYETYTPGPKARTGEEFCSLLDQTLTDPELWAEQRRRVTDLLHSFRDNQASSRVSRQLGLIEQSRHAATG